MNFELLILTIESQAEFISQNFDTNLLDSRTELLAMEVYDISDGVLSTNDDDNKNLIINIVHLQ